MKHWKDVSGELKKYADHWIKKELAFKQLKDLEILFCFRSEPDFDDDGELVAAKASKMGTKQRDVFGYAFMIVVAHDLWKEMSKSQRLRLIWHELNHLQVQYDEDGNLMTDAEGRVKIWLQKHDLVVRSFKDEIEKFGLDAGTAPTAKYLGRAYRTYKETNSRES